MSNTEGSWRIVRQGDSITKLAYEKGLFWETVWNHPENKTLKDTRDDPNILLKGDRVFIPEKRVDDVPCASEKKHSFKRKGIPERIRLQFLDERGQPMADQAYVLTIDDVRIEGHLDDKGWLVAPILPTARKGMVEVGENGQLAPYYLNIGNLDPVSTDPGVMQRLRNLGYLEESNSCDKITPAVEKAVMRFRADHELEGGKLIDDTLRSKIKEVHNS